MLETYLIAVILFQTHINNADIVDTLRNISESSNISPLKITLVPLKY